jgi:RimJ/RimL family protein N-acetyltransferase
MSIPSLPQKLPCGICSLVPVHRANIWVLERLFQTADVKKYYVLRADHARDIRSFGDYLITTNQRQEAMNFVIYDKYDNEVGIITAEIAMNQNTGLPMWNVGYAILPAARGNGYASAALNALTNFLLNNFAIQHVMLDISVDNLASQAVARKCGFQKSNDSKGYIDPDHLEVGIRVRWFKQLAGQRTGYFNQAVQHYRTRNYAEAVQSFKNALAEPYQPGTPYTDAQIYSNMGMAFSSLRLYREAFNALKKAQSLGLNNPSIEKELLWLRNNQGLY